MLRRHAFRQAMVVGGAATLMLPQMREAAAQQGQSADPLRRFEFMGPADDPEFGSVIRSGQPPAGGAAVGTGPARHEEIATAFRILFSQPLRDRAAADGHFGAARWLGTLDETNRRTPRERYNAEWQDAANPLIVAFFGLTNTLPSDGDQTHWCAAFVNFCLFMGGKRGTFSALSGSFRRYGEPTNDPQPGDIAVFSKYGEDGRKGFGHVGFFVRREGSSIILLGGNQRGNTGTTGAVTETSYPAQGRDLELHSFRKVPST